LKTQDQIDDLNCKLVQLQRTNMHMKGQLAQYKEVVETVSKRKTPYDNIGPRISTTRNTVRFRNFNYSISSLAPASPANGYQTPAQET
jgi:hypothetical protein